MHSSQSSCNQVSTSERERRGEERKGEERKRREEGGREVVIYLVVAIAELAVDVGDAVHGGVIVDVEHEREDVVVDHIVAKL